MNFQWQDIAGQHTISLQQKSLVLYLRYNAFERVAVQPTFIQNDNYSPFIHVLMAYPVQKEFKCPCRHSEIAKEQLRVSKTHFLDQRSVATVLLPLRIYSSCPESSLNLGTPLTTTTKSVEKQNFFVTTATGVHLHFLTLLSHDT